MAFQNILNQLKKFSFFDTFKHASTYFSGTILVHMLGIVTLPIYTGYLTADEYGIVNVFTSYLSVTTVLLTLAIHTAIPRYYFEDSKTDFKDFLGTIFITLTLIYGVSSSFIFLFQETISSWTNLPFNLIYWLILTAYGNILIIIYYNLLIAKKKSKKYVTVQVVWQYSKFACTIIGLIYLVGAVSFQDGVATSETFMGKIIGECIATLLLAIYATRQIYKMMSFRNLSFSHVKYALIYSIPLIPFALSNYILTSFDQWFINSSVGHAAAGQYAFAYKIGMIYMGLGVALLNGASPSYYKHMNNKEYKEVWQQVDSMTKLLILGAGFLMLFAVDAGTLLSSKEIFLEALPIAPVIIGAYIFNGISNFSNRGIYYKKKNSYLVLVILTSGIVNILLNWYFIGVKGYTYQAAAYTTLVSYFIMMLFSLFVTKYILKLPPLPLGRILKYIVLLGIIITINYTFGEPNVGLHIGWIIFKGLLFVILSLLLFYNKLGLLLNAPSKIQDEEILDQSKND